MTGEELRSEEKKIEKMEKQLMKRKKMIQAIVFDVEGEERREGVWEEEEYGISFQKGEETKDGEKGEEENQEK